jgi:hypothetical protein
MHDGLAGIYPGTPQLVVPVKQMDAFDVGESFRSGRRGIVPILQVHPALQGFMTGKVERDVPERLVAITTTTTQPPADRLSIFSRSPVEHLRWAHFFQVLAMKELKGEHASIGACILGTPRYVVWAFRDQAHGGWIFTCCLDGSCFEWHPGDEFALYN